MKMSVFKIKYFFMSFIIFMTSFSFIFIANAQISGSPSLDQQQAECAKNTAAEWSATLNRCVGKVEARQTRHDAIDCNSITNAEERKTCQLNLASQKTGVTSNVDEATSKVSNLQSQSAVVNAAGTIIAVLNYFGKDLSQNTCLSKQIFGITSTAGFLTDLYLKIQTKNKIKDFQDKFQIDMKDNPYNTQVKALQYLKEEQELVKEIASLEKKRQMLLMIGYGAAAATAGYESVYNTSCWKAEPKKPGAPTSAATDNTASASSASTESKESKNEVPVATTKPVYQGSTETKPIIPAEEYGPPASATNAAPVASSAAAAAVEKPIVTQQLVSVQKGNYKYNMIEEVTYTPGLGSSSKTLAVVSNGLTYPEGQFKMINGINIATGTPSATPYNYSTGAWDGGTTTSTGIRTNYGATNNAPISQLGFGTDKTKKGP